MVPVVLPVWLPPFIGIFKSCATKQGSAEKMSGTTYAPQAVFDSPEQPWLSDSNMYSALYGVVLFCTLFVSHYSHDFASLISEERSPSALLMRKGGNSIVTFSNSYFHEVEDSTYVSKQ